MKNKLFVLVCALLFLAAPAIVRGQGNQAAAAFVSDTTFSKAKVRPAIGVQAVPFSLTQVRLLAGPFKEAMDRDLKYMLSLENDRLLHSFRLTAGLPSKAAPYGGWEKPDGELRGHTMGHYLSACAFMFASTGDARIKAKADGLIAELAGCQAAIGSKGYLGAFPDEWFDRVEATKKVWAPYYTLHKIMAGFVDWYEYSGNPQALEIVEKMAAWVKMRTDRSDEAHMERVLVNTEQGGMNEVLSNLYSLTGKSEYLALARRFDEKHYTVPLFKYQDVLKGEHVNSFIPNIIGMAREYELTGDRTLSNAARFFWTQVTGARSYATGGTSNDEVWHQDPHIMAGELGRDSHESCCTYNMLKLTRHLFSWDANPAYFDYYERALLNGILPTQNPDNAMMMYYVPMMPGMFRTYMTAKDSFWCCTGSGMENHAKYGDSIYFHDADSLTVNLFIASELDWREKGLRIRQDTRFPEEQGTTLAVTAAKPVSLALKIRIPGWAAKGGSVKVNGKTLEAFAGPGSYLIIRRTWTTGDKVELSLPMSLSLDPLPDDPKIAAVLYGPVVMAAGLGTEGLTDEAVYGKYGPAGDPVAVPKFRVPKPDPAAWIKPVAGKPMTFRTQGVGKPDDVTLCPFYKLFGQRYAVYWTILLPGQTETPAQPRRRN